MKKKKKMVGKVQQTEKKKIIGKVTYTVCENCTGSLCTACYDCVHKCERYHTVHRFFKVMLGKDRSNHMFLPPEFARRVNHLTNQETQIVDSNGERWSVTLSCIDGSLAFQKGWQRFFLDHGLKEGQVLFFNYNKESHFTVHIFGTSACERLNFNNETSLKSKKRRREQGTVSEDELYPMLDDVSKVKPISASGNEFKKLKTNNALQNADFWVSKHSPISLNFEDPISMVSRSDGCHEEEHRNHLNDLSIFEMENKICVATKASGLPGLKNADLAKARELLKSVQQVLDFPYIETEQHDVNIENAPDANVSHSCSRALQSIRQNLDPPCVDTEQHDVNIEKAPEEVDAMELTKTTSEDPPYIETELHDVNFENVSDTNGSHCCNMVLEPSNPEEVDAMELTKTTSEDVEMAVVKTDLITCHSGDIPADKGEKALEAKAVLSPTDAQMAPQSQQTGPCALTKEAEVEDKANVSHSVSCCGNEADVVSSNNCHIEVLKPTNPARDDAMEQTKSTVDDTEMAMIATDIITSSGYTSTGKFAKTLDAKTAVSHTAVTDQITKKGDTPQITPHSRQAGGHSSDASKNKFCEKPCDDSILKKGTLDNVCNFQNVKVESFSVSPSIDISKVAAREQAVKSKSGGISISSLAIKNPSGQRAIKKEVEMDDKANVFHQVFRPGKEPVVMRNHAQMVSPVVKVEPDLMYETDQLDTVNPVMIPPFTAEVKGLQYLELPVEITVMRRRFRSHMFVYLRDSARRLWPVVYREYLGGQAFTLQWITFCKQNNIKPGDKCRFQIEDFKLSIFKVDVTR